MGRIETNIETQTAAGRNGGRFLFAAETDRRRIGLDILSRLAVCAFAAALLVLREAELALPAGAVFLLYSLWPLLHMGDRMEFYQNGILYQGELYPIGQQTRITWVGGRRGLSFFSSTYLDISGCRRRIDVSFMKDAQKLFNRAYSGTMY